MSLKLMESLRDMLIRFGAPMNYWTDEERDAFGDLENEIARQEREIKP